METAEAMVAGGAVVVVVVVSEEVDSASRLRSEEIETSDLGSKRGFEVSMPEADTVRGRRVTVEVVAILWSIYGWEDWREGVGCEVGDMS